MKKSKTNLQPIACIGLFVYNGENYLEESIKSLLSQSFESFELIISDNASSDGTQNICEKYALLDSRIRYYRQETNIGIFNNFRFVKEKGTHAKYFMWAAHDDLWDKNWLEVLIANFKVGDLSLRGTVININENGSTLWKTNIQSFKKNQVVKTFLDNESHGRGFYWYGLFDNQLLQKIDLTSLDNVFGSDTYFITSLVQYGNLRVVEGTNQYYRQHTMSTTKKFSKDWLGLRRYIYHTFPISPYLYCLRIVKPKYKPLILLAIPIKYVKSIFLQIIKLLRLIFTGRKY
ncbi:MAG: glycosyltransferase [Methylophilaceae bacterium]|nr:MAG: glycosyltransferase [Methylophilaceae bacterium]